MSIPTNTSREAPQRRRTPQRWKSRPGFTAYVALCAFAGLRRAEALGVQVGDIDFLVENPPRHPPAPASQARRRGSRQESRGGRRRSQRHGPAPEVRVGADGLPGPLNSSRSSRSTSASTLRPAKRGRWLFDEHGRPWHDNLVEYRWRSTRTDEGVSFKLHELRRYFASGLIAAGCDVVTVQRAMGHASATTTLGTYAHLWPTAEDKTRAAASGMAAAVLATPLPRIEAE